MDAKALPVEALVDKETNPVVGAIPKEETRLPVSGGIAEVLRDNV
jgi:hypothetical protein